MSAYNDLVKEKCVTCQLLTVPRFKGSSAKHSHLGDGCEYRRELSGELTPGTGIHHTYLYCSYYCSQYLNPPPFTNVKSW